MPREIDPAKSLLVAVKNIVKNGMTKGGVYLAWHKSDGFMLLPSDTDAVGAHIAVPADALQSFLHQWFSPLSRPSKFRVKDAIAALRGTPELWSLVKPSKKEVQP